MTVTIYLVRHGETDFNAADRCQGNMDVPMNAAGELQVSELGQRLASVGFDAAYTSPLKRASHSARILLGATTTSLTEVPGLSELSYGDWQGTSYAEWPAEAAARWRDAPWDVSFPNGETLEEVRARVMDVFTTIVRAHIGQVILVTAHGHVNRLLLLTLRKQTPDEFWSVRTPNCSTWKLTVDVNENGEVSLIHCAEVGERITTGVAQRAVDTKTKPLGALGYLESCAVRLSVLQQTLTPSLKTTRVCVFGADHGVSDEGVSAYPRSVTVEMMKNFAAGGAAINVLGRANDVQVEVIDTGVDGSIEGLTNVRHEKVRNGTRNFVLESAMSPEEVVQAVAVGARAIKRAVRDGVEAVGLGEMGIGNTTSAAALLSVLTGQDALQTVGLGTGVSSETLALKRDVVSRAIKMHGVRSDATSARECLRRVGGLELAAIAGAALESLHHHVAIVADGFISTVAILCAAFIAREEFHDGAERLAERVFFAHQSSELGHKLAIESFQSLTGVSQRPLLDLEMRLGEGSGAALAMPVLRSAAAIISEMATFESAGVSSGDKAEHHA